MNSTTIPTSITSLSPVLAAQPKAGQVYTPLNYDQLLPQEMFWVTEDGKTIVSHDGFQLLARMFGVEIEEASIAYVNPNPLMIIHKVIAKGYAPIHTQLDLGYMSPGTRTTSFGEASTVNLTTDISQRYPDAIAQKRAYDRAIKEHLALYGVYSEEESDAFRKKVAAQKPAQATAKADAAPATPKAPTPAQAPASTQAASAPQKTPVKTAPAQAERQEKPTDPTDASQKTAPSAQVSTPATGGPQTPPALRPVQPVNEPAPAAQKAPAAQTKPAQQKPAPQAPSKAPSTPAMEKPAPSKPAPRPAEPAAAPQASSAIAPILENPAFAAVIKQITPNMPKPNANKPTGDFVNVIVNGQANLSAGILGETLQCLWAMASQIGIEQAKAMMVREFAFVTSSLDLNNEQGLYMIAIFIRHLESSSSQAA